MSMFHNAYLDSNAVEPDEPSTEYITPKAGCEWCQGTGEVIDIVDYGDTVARMKNYCECVLDQTKFEDSDIMLVEDGDPRKEQDSAK